VLVLNCINSEIGGKMRLVAGDCGADGLVALNDYDLFSNCIRGAGVEKAVNCMCTDEDGDSDVDLSDLAVLQRNLTGRPE
jgi:hypothetical protein